jgi:hypothetical protein
VVHLLEDNGDSVIQLSLLDHFPTFHANDLLDRASVKALGTMEDIEQKYVRILVMLVIRLLRLDPNPRLRRRQLKLADELSVVARGENGSKTAGEYYEEMRKYAITLAHFFVELGSDADGGFVKWLQQVKAPVSIYVPSEGVRNLATPSDSIHDLGARALFPDCQVYPIQGRGHWDMMEDDGLVANLQSEWQRSAGR